VSITGLRGKATSTTTTTTTSDNSNNTRDVIFINIKPIKMSLTTGLQAPRTLYVESTPSLFVDSSHRDKVNELLGLSDGCSFVSCSDDGTIKRWAISTKDNSNSSSGTGNYKTLELVGTYIGHKSAVCCGLEMDDNTLVTGGYDEVLKVWNINTCECLKSVTTTSKVSALFKTKGEPSHLL